MNFEEYWAAKWQANTMPEIMNITFKEIAREAYEAGREHEADLQAELNAGESL